jgi:hypothetical protein
MKKRKSLSIEEINELNAAVSEKWTPETDAEISNETRRANIGLSKIGIKRPPTAKETKEKMSLTRTGKPLSKETKEKISLALMGKKPPPISEETRQKLSVARKARPFSKKTIDAIVEYSKAQRKEIVIDGVRYESYAAAAEAFGVGRATISRAAKDGKPLTREILDKIRNGGRGPFSEEHRKKLSSARKGKPNLKNAKAVSIEGVVYPSANEAARQLGLIQATVSKRVRSTKEEWKDWFFVDEK